MRFPEVCRKADRLLSVAVTMADRAVHPRSISSAFCAALSAERRHLDLKHLPVTEGTDVEFRSECFNVFNMVSFANPVNVVESANVGQIVSTTTRPRVIQFSLEVGL